MSRSKIVIVTGASPCWAPRAPKEAEALSEAGFDVTILGASGSRRQLEADLKLAADRGFTYEAADAQLFQGSGSILALWAMGIRAKLARKLFRTGHIVTAPLFSPWAKDLARRAMDMQPRLAILHLEPGLRAGVDLVRSGVPIAVDMEDWYSEDLPPQARSGRPVEALRHFERTLLRCSQYSSCTTEVMADVLATEYECPRPLRIYNVFPKPVLGDPAIRRDRSPAAKSMAGSASRGESARSVHWFSQTVGPGRGLEELMAASAELTGEFEIHLRGHTEIYQAWLEDAVPPALRSRVFLHSAVPDDELPRRIAEHDIGFAGEVTSIRSRDLTATNKIFQYLQSGLAVVASNTKGQREVADASAGAVRLYRSGDRSDLQQALRDCLESPEKLAAAKAAARDVAVKTFRWDNEKHRLVESVRNSLERQSHQRSNQ